MVSKDKRVISIIVFTNQRYFRLSVYNSCDICCNTFVLLVLNLFQMRIVFLIFFVSIIYSCNQGSNNRGGGNQGASNVPGELTYDQYCASFNRALNGVFVNKDMEGTMTWSGGVKGQVDVAGPDYNDVTCTYEITDCTKGAITMICDGGGYNTSISLFSPDSIWVGQTPYTRLKE